MRATLHTNLGDIRLELLPDHAPRTVRTIAGLAAGTQEWRDPRTGQQRTGPFYDGLTFHRVIPGFMIQGGDFSKLSSVRLGPVLTRIIA